MKFKFFLGLTLVLVLGLSGCGGWPTGSYVSVTLHQEHWQQELSETMRVSTSVELRSAMEQLVDNRAESGTIVLENYDDEQADADLLQAVNYIEEVYPMGAYAIADISFSKIPDQTIIPITISYSRSKQQMDNVEEAKTPEYVKVRVGEVLREVGSSLTFLARNMKDVDFVQLTIDFAEENPNMVMEIPQIVVNQYPKDGKAQVVELIFSYENSRDALRAMKAPVELAYQAAVGSVNEGADEVEKYSILYSYLKERFVWRFGTSITPSYSLLCLGIGDSKAFAQNFAAMGRMAGLEIGTVVGTRDGEVRHWNICKLGDTYFHLDLLGSIEMNEDFSMRFDEDMEGYVWDYNTYPACIPPTEQPDTDPAGN